jgi:eukaryotic-like serine/threonine-protein kinase
MELPPGGKSSAIADQAIPERLGKYPLLSVIGRGSMGVLYKSIDPHIKRPVALKTIRRDLLDDGDPENFSARFRVEAQAAGRLAHPGIVGVYEYGEQDAYAFIAMEYIEGRSLRECFEQRVPFSISEVVSHVSQLLAALQYAHERGVWHRDIKPANILITGAGQIKVTDFGIARVESSMLTQVGAIMGTPGFIAPEMYLGDTFDHRVDLFATGVVLYQLLVGSPPFSGTAEKVMFKVCYEVPLPPSVAGRLPSLQPFDSVVMRALARDPQERFANAGEFLAALLEAQASSGRANNTDETIIQSGGVSLPGAAAGSGTGGGTGSGINSGSGTPASTNTLAAVGWNLEALGEIERKLARYVGPIAKVMVRRAAREAKDIVQLTNVLADKIPKTEHRNEFLKRVGVLSNPESALPHIAPAAAAAGQSNGAGHGTGSQQRLLTPEDVSRATQLLTAHMGPIAPVLAKRAAKPDTTREQFIAALASYLKDDAARSRFLDALR